MTPVCASSLVVKHQANDTVDFNAIIRGWQELLDHLLKVDVMDAPSLKRLVDGTMLAEALGGVKRGKWMMQALDVCIAWQLRNPGETDPAGAIEEVRARAQELQIPLRQ